MIYVRFWRNRKYRYSPLSHQIDRIPTKADPLHGPWRLPSRQRQTGNCLPIALRKRVDGQPEVLRTPGEIGTHKHVQELLRRFVGRGGADEQKIDKPLRFREPVQGPRSSSVSQSRARDEPSLELRRAPNNTPAIAMAKSP